MSVNTAECPGCAAAVEIPADAVESEILQCAECELEIEIMSLNPLTLAEAPEEEEDWGE